MRVIDRALFALRCAFASAIISLPVLAAAQDIAPVDMPVDTVPSEPAVEIPQPTAIQSGDQVPWLYEGSDIPRDDAWVFGRLDNGLRYAVRANRAPPGQVAIRVRIDAGALHERDSEQGYAHLLEHLLYRESAYIEQGQAIATWQRLGAEFGSDSNAETTPTHTAYKLDLPNVTRAKLDEGIRLLSGMIKSPVLSDENVTAEVPIVLAEKRERGGTAERVNLFTRRIIFAGQRLADRQTIGTVETLKSANAQGLREFHQRWYRPEKTVVTLVGDAPVEVLAGVVEKYFGDWEGQGMPGEAPDFGDPAPPAGAPTDTDWPIGQAGVLVEADLPRTFSYSVMRPWRRRDDTIAFNQNRTVGAIALAIINRRLEARARVGGSYLYAEVDRTDLSRSANATSVTFVPLDKNWQKSLSEVRAVIADAQEAPPTQEEIDREFAEFEIAYTNQLEQDAVLASNLMAETLVMAVDIREAIASSEVSLEIFRGSKPLMTPANILAESRELFVGSVVRATYLTPGEGEAEAATVKLALAQEVQPDNSARLAKSTLSFDDLPPIGEPGTIVSREPIGLMVNAERDIEQIEFANGVRALVWENAAEPGRANVKVRFGAGYRAFDADNAVYASLGEFALFDSGIGDLDQEDIDRLATGRKMGKDFAIEDAVFSFSAETRAADAADQLYLFAAKLGMPNWDPNPVLRARAASKLAYQTFATSPSEIMNRDLDYLLNDRDPRFATPTPEMLDAATAEGFRETWEPLLQQGPVEVLVFGEIDREAIVEQLRRTFGALPQRKPIPQIIAERMPSFPVDGTAPAQIFHNGDPDQAAAVVSWPVGGGVTRLRESRQLEIYRACSVTDCLKRCVRRPVPAMPPKYSPIGLAIFRKAEQSRLWHNCSPKMCQCFSLRQNGFPMT